MFYNGMQNRGGFYGGGGYPQNPPLRLKPMKDQPMENEMDDEIKKDYASFSRFPIGMAYVPWQKMGELYDPEVALNEGTIFPELNLVFCGVRG